MKIYIEEAGSFAVPSKPSSISLVLALIIPSASEAQILYEFLRIRDSWQNRNVEIKGTNLDESQGAQIIQMLAQNEVLVNFFAIDTAAHPDHLVDDFKDRQADGVLSNLSAGNDLDMASRLQDLARTIRKMPNPLFVQAFLTVNLVQEIIREATLYYAQRLPKELGDIAWIIDRKDHSIDEIREMWTTLILPMSEFYLGKKTIAGLVGGDYTYFDARYAFTAETVEKEIARHLEWLHAVYGVKQENCSVRGINTKLLLSEQLSFDDSLNSLGLQLADILATILRRAFDDSLPLNGGGNFGNLLVGKHPPGSSFLQLGGNKDASQVLQGHARKVCLTLYARSKSMLP